MKMNSYSLFIITFIYLISFSTCQLYCNRTTSSGGSKINRVRLIRNGYEGLLIAIHHSLPESQRLIDEIKDAYTEASIDLFTATNNRAFFRKITILIPQNWKTIKIDDIATSESFEEGNIIVTRKSREWGDNPHTYMKGGDCGTPGSHTLLSDGYLFNKQLSENLFGPIGKTLVHEWGHLRWGLLDEYNWQGGQSNCRQSINPETNKPSYIPVRCSESITGQIAVHKGKCWFRPDTNQRAEASIMYMHFLSDIVKFCNSGNNTDEKHDKDADNPHNAVCDGKSAWDILNKHEDFLKGSNPPIDSETNVRPTFKIVRRSDAAMVMIYDVSGSMLSQNRLKQLQRAAQIFFTSKTIANASVGSIEFETRARITHNMVRVVSNTERQSLINAIPRRANGRTCIGCGLRMGLKILNDSKLETKGASIIIITDGDENQPPLIREVAAEILVSGVKIYPLLLINAYSTDLAELARCTGGRPLSYSDQGQSSGMYELLSQILQWTAPNRESAPVMLKSENYQVKSGQITIVNASIDNDLTNYAKFVFTWNLCQLQFSLTAPDGFIIDKTKPDFYQKVDNLVLIDAANRMAGVWKVQMETTGFCSSGTTVKMIVESYLEDDNKPKINFNGWISHENANFTNLNDLPKVSLHAELRYGKTPIINGKIQATIESDNAFLLKTLLDNGAGSDLIAGDGIYSAYFFEFKKDGLYNIKYAVKSEKNTKALSKGRSYAQGALPVKFDDIEYDEQTIDLPAFERDSVGGTVSMSNVPPSGVENLYPPSKIKDLLIANRTKDNIVTITWTAVGSTLDSGKAKQYEIKYAYSSDDLRFECNQTCNIINQNDLIIGNLTKPKNAGDNELFTVKLHVTQRPEKVFMALNSISTSNQKSSISNIVSYDYIVNAPLPSSTSKGLSGGAIAGIVIGCIAVLAVIIVIVAILKKKKFV